MKNRIQSYFALPVMIAATWTFGTASAYAQGAAAAPAAAAGNPAATFLQGLLAGAGQGGAQAGGRGGAGNGAFQTASVVRVVADTTGNNLIVNAPDEIMKQIDALIDELDVPNEDTTVFQVFPLKNSDPTEMVSLITSLFPDPNSTANRGNNARGGGGFQLAGGGGRGGVAGGTSERALKMQKVVAVAELRTSSVIVSASSQMMRYVQGVIEEIDLNPREAQEVAVLKLKGDVTSIQTVLQSLFGRNASTANTQNNPLVNRTTFLNGGGATAVGGGTGTAARGAQ